MIDKISGHVAYAVAAFGGFLGMGEARRAIPWSVLHYDTSLDGYVAKTDGSVDWLLSAESHGYPEFLASIDTVLMGRETFDQLRTLEGEGSGCKQDSRYQPQATVTGSR